MPLSSPAHTNMYSRRFTFSIIILYNNLLCQIGMILRDRSMDYHWLHTQVATYSEWRVYVQGTICVNLQIET